jgi:protein gp37
MKYEMYLLFITDVILLLLKTKSHTFQILLNYYLEMSAFMSLIPVQSVPITTKVVSSNPAHGEVYSIQYYVIQFVSDLRQVSGFLRFPPPIKLTATI